MKVKSSTALFDQQLQGQAVAPVAGRRYIDTRYRPTFRDIQIQVYGSGPSLRNTDRKDTF